MHIFRARKIQVFIQVGDHVLCYSTAIWPSLLPLLTIIVIQAVMWSINYINPLNTSNNLIYKC